MVGWGVSAIIVFAFPPLNTAIGSWAILPIPIIATVITVLLVFHLPETKGKTVNNCTMFR
jgi:hypothetical protein